MKHNFVIIFIRFVIAVIILCCGEYLYGRFVMQEVITGQDSLIWGLFILGGIFIALLGIAANHLINKGMCINSNALLFVNIVGALVASLLYVIICINLNEGLFEFNRNKNETDYLLLVILSLFVLFWSVLEGIIYRISIK